MTAPPTPSHAMATATEAQLEDCQPVPHPPPSAVTTPAPNTLHPLSSTADTAVRASDAKPQAPGAPPALAPASPMDAFLRDHSYARPPSTKTSAPVVATVSEKRKGPAVQPHTATPAPAASNLTSASGGAKSDTKSGLMVGKEEASARAAWLSPARYHFLSTAQCLPPLDECWDGIKRPAWSDAQFAAVTKVCEWVDECHVLRLTSPLAAALGTAGAVSRAGAQSPSGGASTPAAVSVSKEREALLNVALYTERIADRLRRLFGELCWDASLVASISGSALDVFERERLEIYIDALRCLHAKIPQLFDASGLLLMSASSRFNACDGPSSPNAQLQRIICTALPSVEMAHRRTQVVLTPLLLPTNQRPLIILAPNEQGWSSHRMQRWKDSLGDLGKVITCTIKPPRDANDTSLTAHVVEPAPFPDVPSAGAGRKKSAKRRLEKPEKGTPAPKKAKFVEPVSHIGKRDDAETGGEDGEAVRLPTDRNGNPSAKPSVIVAEELFLTLATKVAETRARHGNRPIVVIGRGVGARVACEVAARVQHVSAVVCIDFPLLHAEGAISSSPLLLLSSPVFFAVGSQCTTSPIAILEKVRRQMKAPSFLLVVEGAHANLRMSVAEQLRLRTTQEHTDARVLQAISAFLARTFASLVEKHQSAALQSQAAAATAAAEGANKPKKKKKRGEDADGITVDTPVSKKRRKKGDGDPPTATLPPTPAPVATAQRPAAVAAATVVSPTGAPEPPPVRKGKGRPRAVDAAAARAALVTTVASVGSTGAVVESAGTVGAGGPLVESASNTLSVQAVTTRALQDGAASEK